eukprot:TRINITY_DN10568_c0_g1_i1.p1 TRINITY_DN10568_c0_g1~~TRINITY_DN10568_c0_g1_i1.p1  ORF type:complete len:163 (+),score=20.16 TRINITY_DN10568_c0_g1_i1:138-626(+)
MNDFEGDNFLGFELPAGDGINTNVVDLREAIQPLPEKHVYGLPWSLVRRNQEKFISTGRSNKYDLLLVLVLAREGCTHVEDFYAILQRESVTINKSALTRTLSSLRKKGRITRLREEGKEFYKLTKSEKLKIQEIVAELEATKNWNQYYTPIGECWSETPKI